MGLLDFAKGLGATAQRYQTAEAVRAGRAAPAASAPSSPHGLLGSLADLADRYQRAENARIRGVPMMAPPSGSATAPSDQDDFQLGLRRPSAEPTDLFGGLPGPPRVPGPPAPMQWNSAEPVDLSIEWLSPIISGGRRRSL